MLVLLADHSKLLINKSSLKTLIDVHWSAELSSQSQPPETLQAAIAHSAQCAELEQQLTVFHKK